MTKQPFQLGQRVTHYPRWLHYTYIATPYIMYSIYPIFAGFDGTSNVLAGKLFGIPVKGTHAHAFVTSFTDLSEIKNRVSLFWLLPSQISHSFKAATAYHITNEVFYLELYVNDPYFFLPTDTKS